MFLQIVLSEMVCKKTGVNEVIIRRSDHVGVCTFYLKHLLIMVIINSSYVVEVELVYYLDIISI